MKEMKGMAKEEVRYFFNREPVVFSDFREYVKRHAEKGPFEPFIADLTTNIGMSYKTKMCFAMFLGAYGLAFMNDVVKDIAKEDKYYSTMK